MAFVKDEQDQLDRMMAAVERDRAKDEVKRQEKDMRRRGVSYGNPAAIQDGIADVVKMLGHTARMSSQIDDMADRTEEGKRKQWEKRTATHRARLDRLEKAIDDLVVSADREVTQAWEKLFPAATGEQATQTAEMYVSRVLGRGKMDHIQLAKIVEEEPSPGRTLLLEEIVARGWFKHDQVDRFVAETPEFRQVRQAVAKVKADADVLRMQLEFARERVVSMHAANRPEQRYEGMLNVRTDGVGDDAVLLEDWNIPERSVIERY